MTVVGFLGEGWVLDECERYCRDRFIQTIKYTDHKQIGKMRVPDTIFVFRYKKIIPKSLIQRYNLAFVMTHYGKLPEYRGYYPINQAVRRGDRKIGVTMFYGDTGIDTGDIIDYDTVSIDINERITQIYFRCDYCAVDMFKRNLIKITNGTAPRIKQTCPPNWTKFRESYRKEDLPAYIDTIHTDPLILHNFIRSRTGLNQEPAYIEDDEYRLYFDKTTLVKK